MKISKAKNGCNNQLKLNLGETKSKKLKCFKNYKKIYSGCLEVADEQEWERQRQKGF